MNWVYLEYATAAGKREEGRGKERECYEKSVCSLYFPQVGH
ncbi:hypothetical protein [Paenibacillus elgii]|nr:hypothetical protein [Paenibacillus elgii]